MQFKIEQIALAINLDRENEAMALLKVLGITDWVHDTVVAAGSVFQRPSRNTADLSFNYTALQDAKELELLRYREGDNWMRYEPGPRASHIGMHVTEDELAEWRKVLNEEFGLAIVQEVLTESHTNPVIAGKRWYHYVIFGAVHLIGIDIKFIVRRDQP